jgi:hypothetical protein
MGRHVTRADLGVAASLAARRLFGRRRLPACGSAPMWLSFVVGLAVGFYLTADSILDRWWLNRGPGPTGTPVTPA